MHRIVFKFAIVLCAASALAADARCPDGREDAARGLLITHEYALQMAVTVSPDGLVRIVQTVEGDPMIAEFEALHGILPRLLTNRRSAAEDAYVNGFAITWSGEAMPAPVPGLAWRGEGTLAYHHPDAGNAEVAFEAAVTGSDEIVIGACQYDTVVVETVMNQSDATFTTQEVVDYLPTLGIALVRQNRTVMKGDEPGDWYDWSPGLSIAVMDGA